MTATIAYTSKPDQHAREYTATVGQYRIMIEKMATDYMPWCVFIVHFDGPTYTESNTLTTALHTDAHTLAEAKQIAEKFVTTEGSAATCAASLTHMPAAQLIAELESCVRQNTYGSHAEQMEMVRKEIIARMSN